MQKLLSYLRRGVDEYKMINEGDHITVGVSGGKDSLALLCGLSKLRDFYPNKFTLSAVTLDMGFGMDFSPVRKLCEELNVPYVVRHTDIAEILFDIRKESNPCSLCAKMRRGALHDAALELGSHKVALGHHNDDALDTFMLSLLYEGRINCFSPMTYLDRKDITLIRPMIYIDERDIIGYAKNNDIPVVKNTCPADGLTKRQYVDELISKINYENRGFKDRLFTAIKDSHIKGWNDLN